MIEKLALFIRLVEFGLVEYMNSSSQSNTEIDI